MIYGYIRVSTRKQAVYGNSLEEQRDILLKNGVQKLYQDVYTGKSMDRPEFDKLKQVLQPGDTLIITKLDRIARTAVEGFQTIKELLDRGVEVVVLNMGRIETKTPMGKAMLQVMLAYAEMERDMINERCQGGRAYKRATDPDYREGRPRAPKKQVAGALEDLERMSYKEAAERHGISVSTLQRAARRDGKLKTQG